MGLRSCSTNQGFIAPEQRIQNSSSSTPPLAWRSFKEELSEILVRLGDLSVDLLKTQR